MSPTEASAEPDGPGSPAGGDGVEDTLELRLPGEFVALFGHDRDSREPASADREPASADREPASADREPASADREPPGATPGDASEGENPGRGPFPGEDLLDALPEWGAVATPIGSFQLVPVRIERDLPLISRWMNDPAVAAFWELAGPESVTEHHLGSQLAGDGRSVPCLGVLDGVPTGYFEIYRADLDPLARHYPARPHDTGIHLLIGGVADRGRGVGTALLRATADHVLARRPHCARVVAEPDLRNTPSVAAFLSAGFRFSAEVDLPGKRAALMVRDRALSKVL
ncbi:GNAT family N-acetyltransferase [Streptomyces tirandamycinicus]|uniref:GNAT family N-acetyltransferase n=1 Tax=Streptomyces tirandamycinicus TaxID=2174846 RepID=UPI00226F8E99|nr:GNAT family N-acetyltransferase [Streptomyces tirandamycinicus]MCY0983455.1 GNAT family N-acetyltransferase [Streptomyces tirandamycinicus]